MQAVKIKPEYSFRINDFRVDPGENTVSLGDEKRQIEPRAMQVLVVLSLRAGETVTRPDLLSEVWGDRVVVEEALTRIISQLRGAFNDSKTRKFIQTVPKKGYRLNAQVTQSLPASAQRAASASPVDIASPEPLPLPAAHEPVESVPAGNTETAGQGGSPESEAQATQASAPESQTPLVPTSQVQNRMVATKSRYWAAILIVALVTTILLFVNSDDSVTETGSVTGRVQLNAGAQEQQVSIAVLPLERLSPDQDTLYLAEGLPEELLDELARIPEMLVPSRYSTFALSQREQEERKIAAALNVRYLLEGSVRRIGADFKVVMRLVDTAEDRVIWSEGFEDSASRLYEIPGNVAVRVQQTLLPQRAVAAVSERQSGVDNVEAYQHYLQGVYWLMNGTTSEWFYRAESAFKKAVDADPDYAAAHGSLAYIYARYNYHDTFMDAEQAQASSRDAIEKALSVQPDEPNALFANAILNTSASDFDGAESALRKVLQSSDDNTTALYLFSELELARNNPDAALDYALRAKQKDSLSPWVNVNLAIVRFWRGELQQALDAAENAIRIDNDYTWAYVWKAKILQYMGQTARAIKAMERCTAIDDSSPTNNAFLGLLYLELDKIDAARQWFDRTAVLYGNTDDARFWQQFERLAYRRQDPDIGSALLDKLTLVDNRIFSLLPILFQLQQQTAEQPDTGAFSVFADEWQQQGGTVNYLNQHKWLGAVELDLLSEQENAGSSFSKGVAEPQDQHYLYDSDYTSDEIYPWLWMMQEASLPADIRGKVEKWRQAQTVLYHSRLSD